MPYEKSAPCSLLVKETADVVISIITKNVAWGFTSLRNEESRPVCIQSAKFDAPSSVDGRFSVSPLQFNEATLAVHGFTTPETEGGTIGWGGGVGPVHSGQLQIDLYLWGSDDTTEFTLSIDRNVEVRFRFGEQNWKQVVYVPPVNGQPQGTVFKWPTT